MAYANCLGAPRGHREIILVTVASHAGGVGMLFEWQAPEKEKLDSAISQWGTDGLNRDGTLKHSYPDNLISRAQSQQRKIQNQEKDAQPGRKKRKIVFSDLRNPPKRFTPLFGEVGNRRTLTESLQHKSRQDSEVALASPKTLRKVHAVGGRDLCAPQHRKEKQTTRQH